VISRQWGSNTKTAGRKGSVDQRNSQQIGVERATRSEKRTQISRLIVL